MNGHYVSYLNWNEIYPGAIIQKQRHFHKPNDKSKAIKISALSQLTFPSSNFNFGNEDTNLYLSETCEEGGGGLNGFPKGINIPRDKTCQNSTSINSSK